MLKKIITGTLVLIVLSTSSIVVYAGPTDEFNIDGKQAKMEIGEIVIGSEEVEQEKIQIISPQIQASTDGEVGEVIADKNLLISINVLEESSVTLSVYKVVDETETLLFDPEVIEPKTELESDYVKQIKNIELGKYKMVFSKDGEEEPIKVVEFQVKRTEEVVNEDNDNVLPALFDINITDLLLGE